MGGEEGCMQCFCGNAKKGREYYNNRSVGGRILFKWILDKYYGTPWTDKLFYAR
jgi:hypothetical protein